MIIKNKRIMALKYFILLPIICLIFSCSKNISERGSKLEDIFGNSFKRRDCLMDLPADLEKQIREAYKENIDQRNKAIDAEVDRLNIKPLKVSHVINDSISSSPGLEDPYPESVVVIGDDYDRKYGYQITHGKMNSFYVYETFPGSQQYFIVDEIGGDGLGGNGQSVVAETSEYPMSLNLSLQENENSWHSWYSSPSNELVRAYQEPEDDLQSEVSICGCGPKDEVLNLNDAAEPMRRPLGIFLLPGTAFPSFMDESAFKAIFQRKYFKKNYIPKEGYKCREYEWVC